MPTNRPSAEADSANALDTFMSLLCTVASGQIVNRAEATSYVNCRETLLASPARSVLPGFVLQCQTVLRFREFISLYDPAPARREAFVEASLRPAREALGSAPRAAPAKPESRRWNF